MSHYKKNAVKDAARGQWRRIFHSLAGIGDEYIVDRERSCPTCDGETRWRVYPDFDKTGGCRCNACDTKKGWGDGFAFLQWKLQKPFKEILTMVGEFLNVQPSENRKRPRQTAKKLAEKRPEKPQTTPNSDAREALQKKIKELEKHRVDLMKAGKDFTPADEELSTLRAQFSNLKWLADELGVSVASLEKLGAKWDAKSNSWQNPEFDSKRKTIGTSKRLFGGKKSFVSGGHRGLCFADGWENESGPVLIVEGLSDTASGITHGLCTIGRPSNGVPKGLQPELIALLRSIPTDRQIIVVAENDKDPDTDDWPGRDGAVSTAKFLAAELKRTVTWALPPDGAKDLRHWFQLNPDKSGSDFVSGLNGEDTAASDTREPASEIDPKEDAEFYLQNECNHADGTTLRFYRGSFWSWRNNRWIEVSADDVRANVAMYLGERYLKVTSRAISNVIEFVRALTIIPSNTDMPIWLDGRTGYSIAFQNGVAALDDLILGKPDCLRPHSPMWFSEVILPYDYQPEAECPTWLDVLLKNLEADVSRIDLLQEFSGYCLTKSTEHHSALTLIGDGRNGKSVTLAGITAILGKQNVSSLSLDELSEKFKSCRVVGKLANVCADLSETSKVCEGTLKKLISGDALEFERKGRDPFSAIPTAKLIFSTNTLPQFYDRSNGLWRRLIIMPFNRQVTETEKVTGMDQGEWWLRKGELPGMFNWALQGLKQLKRNGAFTESRRCTEALSQHRLECNHALFWLRQEFELTDDGSEYSKPLMYSQYVDYCRASGYKQLGDTAFGKEVVKAFGPLETSRSFDPFKGNGARSRFYCGLRRIPDESAKRDQQPF